MRRLPNVVTALAAAGVLGSLVAFSCALPADFEKVDELPGEGGSGGDGGAGAGGTPLPDTHNSCPDSQGQAITDACGPDEDDDCCTTLLVEAGDSFSRMYDGTSYFDDPQWMATVSDFYLDKYEVTVGRFKAFVQAVDEGWRPDVGDGTPKNSDYPGWTAAFSAQLPGTATAFDDYFATCNDGTTWVTWIDSDETLAINCVNWYVSYAFCIWDGGRLPTDAEWNYVASDGQGYNVYPWGSDTPAMGDLVWGCDENGTCAYNVDGVHSPGRKPFDATSWGHMDMGGNLAEWMLDHWDVDNSSAPFSSTDCQDCVELQSMADNPNDHRVGRGGAFFSGTGTLPDPTDRDLRSANHYSMFAGSVGYGSGIRCARDVPEQ